MLILSPSATKEGLAAMAGLTGTAGTLLYATLDTSVCQSWADFASAGSCASSACKRVDLSTASMIHIPCSETIL